MTDIYYYSITGNTKAFAWRFYAEGYAVKPVGIIKRSDPFVLFTPTYHFGNVPDRVIEFVDEFSEDLVGVVTFGNRNWGRDFATAGYAISKDYDVPLLGEVELRGTDVDFERILLALNEIGGDAGND